MLPALLCVALAAQVTSALGGWTVVNKLSTPELSLAAGARCGDSEDFSFAYSKGSTEGLVIEFEGGGICYDKETCLTKIGTRCVSNKISRFFAPTSVDYYLSSGVHNRSEPRNPFGNFSHVYIPYCTCDFHVGTNAVSFDEPASGSGPDSIYVVRPDGTTVNFTVTPAGARPRPGEGFHFNGYRNFRYVMQWIDANLGSALGLRGDPSKVIVAGCSAGAFGTTFLQDRVFDRFARAQHVSLADSAFGSIAYLPINLWSNVSDPDNMAYTPRVQEFLEVQNFRPLKTRDLGDVQAAVAKAYPKAQLATFAWLDDKVINDQPGLLLQVNGSQANATCNLKFFVAAGEKHCIVGGSSFFTTALQDGSLLVDNVARLVAGDCVESVLANDVNITDFDYCGAQSVCRATPPSETTPSPQPAGSAAVVVGAVAGGLLLTLAMLWCGRKCKPEQGADEKLAAAAYNHKHDATQAESP
jgi:hypothetical protein